VDRSKLNFDTFETPLGSLYIIMMGSELVGLTFEKPHMKAGAAPESLRQEIEAYFDGRRREFTQNFAFISGTEFERQVWLALSEIPYGETRTYKWMAQRVGRPRGSRAVGQALKKNPIPIVIPCHRVIESDGKIGGFALGQDIKRRLLQMEFYNLRKE